MITAREKLVHIRVTLTNQIQGLLKTFGVVLPPGRNSVFERSVIECEPSLDAIKPIFFLLLDAWNDVSLQIREMNILLVKHAKSDPGDRTLTAISFKTVIDDPQRFQSVADVGAFLGVTPKIYQSGEVDRNGGISKHGNRQTRSLLYEAAHVQRLSCSFLRTRKLIEKKSVG
jgi:transposase